MINNFFMKRTSFVFMAVLMGGMALGQSVGIGTATPDASAKVQVSGSAQGMLTPRLSLAQRDAIVNPATGLLVYQTDGTPGFFYYNGSAWTGLTGGIANGSGASSTYGWASTFAGNGSQGFSDGIAGAALFFVPHCMATDLAGNIYVTDYHAVRKISPGGVVTTLAGGSTAGSNDGQGTAATFNSPNGLAVDLSGTIYVADSYNNKIRKISPGGMVTTLAGSGLTGSADGAPATASFNIPVGITLDQTGNIYVADSHNKKIRKVAADGTVTTIAGSGATGGADGIGLAASFNACEGITADRSGNLYVSDGTVVRKINSGGVVTSIPLQSDLPVYTRQIAADANGNLYVANQFGSILKLTPDGVTSVLLGYYTVTDASNGTGSNLVLNTPYGIAVDGSGNVYISELFNYDIRRILTH
jgi:sugar lactone lactonase YvrE